MSEESKVRLWIWGGFASVLLLLAVVSIVSYLSFEGSVVRFSESARVVGNTVRVLSADRDVAAFRRYVANYLDSGDTALLGRAHELVAEANKELADALESTKSAERRQLLQRLQELLESFSVRFDQAIKLRDKKQELVKETDSIGQRNRIALTEYAKAFHSEGIISDTAETVETLMRSRLGLARIADTFDADRAKATQDFAATYLQEIRKLAASQPPDRRARLVEIVALADSYGATLANAVETMAELKKLTDEVMEAIGKELSSTAKTLRGLQTKRQAELNEDVGDYILQAKATIGLLTAIAIVLGILCALLISRTVSRPIAEMATAARVAGEIGELIKLAAHDGDFRNRTPTQGRTGFVGTISVAVNHLFDSVCVAFASIGRNATNVAVAASDASGAVVEVNAGAAEQARSLEQIREAIRMSAEGVTKVSDNAKTASASADAATRLVNRGQITIAELAELMETIARNGREVARVTQSLGQIATKTDILATTTAVEAARLGEHGRSFAVIGQQVGTLAEHATAFANQISELVEVSNRDLQAGLIAAEKARAVVDDIQRQVADTDTMIRTIAEAMLAQQSAILEIDATADGLAQIGEHNVQAGEQISRRLVELRALSEATRDAIARFKIEGLSQV